MRVNEQGRSMIEMLGVLAIVGVLSVGGIAGYSKAMNKFKTNKVIDQVNMIATNVRTMYSSQKSYSGLKNSLAKKTGLIPGEMYSSVSTSDVQNAFGGAAKIIPAANMNADDNQAFILAVDKIPQASCVSIATTEWGGDSGSGLLAIYIEADTTVDAVAAELDKVLSSTDGSANLAVNGNTSGYGLPFTLINASQACGKNESVIAWKYI